MFAQLPCVVMNSVHGLIHMFRRKKKRKKCYGVPSPNTVYRVTFDNGKSGVFDMNPYLNFGIFSEVKKYFLAFLILSLLIIPCGCKDNNFFTAAGDKISKGGLYNSVLVTKVIDGDTIKIETGKKVRLIGIDCPETYYSKKQELQAKRTHNSLETIQRIGEEAKQYAEKLLENKKVRLEFDTERYDKYERLLAYVYLEDGTFVNARILEMGLAQTLTIPPNMKYRGMFGEAEARAKIDKKGLWKR